MYGPPNPSGERWLQIKASGSSYCLFTLFFPGSPHVIWEGSLSVLRIIANLSLTGIPPLAFSQDGAVALPSRRIIFLLPELFQCSSTHGQQVCRWFSHSLASLLSRSLGVQSFCFLTSFCWKQDLPKSLVPCSEGEFSLLGHRPNLRCRFVWSGGVSFFWRFWCPTWASHLRRGMEELISAAPYSSSWIALDSRVAACCVCNPQLAPATCGSAYRALSSGFKGDDMSV